MKNLELAAQLNILGIEGSGVLASHISMDMSKMRNAFDLDSWPGIYHHKGWTVLVIGNFRDGGYRLVDAGRPASEFFARYLTAKARSLREQRMDLLSSADPFDLTQCLVLCGMVNRIAWQFEDTDGKRNGGIKFCTASQDAALQCATLVESYMLKTMAFGGRYFPAAWSATMLIPRLRDVLDSVGCGSKRAET